MSRRRGPPDGERPALTDEDRALWEHAARTMQPVRRAKPRVDDRQTVPPEMPRPETDPMRATGRALNLGSSPRPLAGEPAKKPRPAPELAPFDRKVARRLGRGTVPIEARLDLHGMRQSEAHAALRSFLLGCQSRGLRWVLVITGKGVASRLDPGDESGFVPGHGREVGVLRRSVPRWLAEPELRAIVVSYETASLRHGGEGALYVHLRGRRAATRGT
ncbi:MAG: Smr/MutS family protein [Pseudomonadota bacterium]